MARNGTLGNNDVCCSFCGRSRDQVNKLIQGRNGVFICDECVGECSDILTEANASMVEDVDFDHSIPIRRSDPALWRFDRPARHIGDADR